MSEFDPLHDHEHDVAVQEPEQALQQPPLYHVLLLNDDFTPMDFVVRVLIDFFYMDETKATHVMLQVHTQGMAICGTYPKDVAETKVALVNEFAREHHHPLLCTMDEAD
ncbi:MAG: ATP-dependent Clp protease adapter ClpS [Methylococcales bacterium]|nr:ATP-dependent Clp protease adapter ClpS [Methylococcales bacterium]